MKAKFLTTGAFAAMTLFMVSYAAKANPGEDLTGVLFGSKKAAAKAHIKKVATVYKPSLIAEDNLYANFGTIDPVMWSADGAMDVARFNYEGREIKAFFDVEGQFVGTVENKQFGDLPEKAKAYIAKKYGDSDIMEVIYFDDNVYSSSTMNVYDQMTQDEDNYFISLKKGDQEIVLRVDMAGGVHVFKVLNID